MPALGHRLAAPKASFGGSSTSAVAHSVLAIIVGLCCSAVVLLTAAAPINQAGGVDTFVYLGFIHDYRDLLERFGPSYYSERIAYIYPARFLAYAFGAEGGYFALAFIGLAAAVAAVFAIGMRFFGLAPAVLIAVWVGFVPWLPRALLQTYVDGLAVVYVLIGIAFLFFPRRRRVGWHVAAGVSFALAIDCNLFVLAICALLGPGWAFFYRRGGFIWLVNGGAAVAVGIFCTYLLLAALIHAEFPGSEFFSYEREALQFAMNGEEEKYFRPLSLIIWHDKSFLLLIPLVFAVASSFGAMRQLLSAFPNKALTLRFDFEAVAVLYLACIVCLALILHFGLHDGWLRAQFYLTYFVPGCALALLVLCSRSQMGGSLPPGDAGIYGGAALIVLLWLVHPLLPRMDLVYSWSFWLVVAAVVIAAAAAAPRSAMAAFELVPAAALLSACVYCSSAGNYYQIRDPAPKREAIEWDVYRGAIFLQDFLNSSVPPNESLGFWYNDTHDLPHRDG